MYFAAVICVMFAAVSAGRAALPVPEPGSDQPWPEKCCSASAYTYKAESLVSSVKDGSLFTESIQQHGAYDSVDKRISIAEATTFPNGTEEHVKTISDYKHGVEYRITSEAGTVDCEKSEITTRFPYNCLPEESEFLYYETIGDRDLISASWYVLYTDHPTDNVHVVYTFKHPECVDLGYVSRATDKATGAGLWTDFHRRSDYSLGICNPEEWFNPPPECQAAELKQRKVRQRSRGRLGPRGRRPVLW